MAIVKPEKENPIPVDIVGSSTFGIYPKISLAKTYNMFISDNAMISFAGYKILNDISNGKGRGLFHSVRGDFAIAVMGANVYKINKSFGAQDIGRLETTIGQVSIDENLSSQICIVDGSKAYIFNNSTGDFTVQTLDVGAFDLVPGYVVYHNSFFLIAPAENEPNNNNNWYAFQKKTGTDDEIELVTGSVFPLQTKPDICLAIERLPGRSNHVIVFGSVVTEVWTNVGGEDNYRRNSSFNIDNGTASKDTIATSDQFVCWLSKSEKNTPAIMITDGSNIKRISTDGIDNLLLTIKNPEQSIGFIYRQNGHLFYILTFYNNNDNLTLAYDLMLDKFYHLTDNNMNYHIARQTIYFNEKTLFVSLNDGALYEMALDIIDAINTEGADSGDEIPRVRVTSAFRLPNANPFRIKSISLVLEQGVNQFSKLFINETLCTELLMSENDVQLVSESGVLLVGENSICADELGRPRIDLSVSKNGGQTFSNSVGLDLQPEGEYRNRLRWRRLGRANEITYQFRFNGLQRFVILDALAEVY